MHDKDIETIMQWPVIEIIPLILEALEPWQIGKIRNKLKPHWADGSYGKWSHEDPLFEEVFVDGGKHLVNYRNDVDDWENDYFNHCKCQLCGELLLNSESFTDSRYSHLFANCTVASNLRVSSNSEEEFRIMVTNKIKEVTNAK